MRQMIPIPENQNLRFAWDDVMLHASPAGIMSADTHSDGVTSATAVASLFATLVLCVMIPWMISSCGSRSDPDCTAISMDATRNAISRLGTLFARLRRACSNEMLTLSSSRRILSSSPNGLGISSTTESIDCCAVVPAWRFALIPSSSRGRRMSIFLILFLACVSR